MAKMSDAQLTALLSKMREWMAESDENAAKAVAMKRGGTIPKKPVSVSSEKKTLPVELDWGKGIPKDRLRYINAVEEALIKAHRATKAKRSHKGVPAYADDSASSMGTERQPESSYDGYNGGGGYDSGTTYSGNTLGRGDDYGGSMGGGSDSGSTSSTGSTAGGTSTGGGGTDVGSNSGATTAGGTTTSSPSTTSTSPSQQGGAFSSSYNAREGSPTTSASAPGSAFGSQLGATNETTFYKNNEGLSPAAGTDASLAHIENGSILNKPPAAETTFYKNDQPAGLAGASPAVNMAQAPTVAPVAPASNINSSYPYGGATPNGIVTPTINWNANPDAQYSTEQTSAYASPGAYVQPAATTLTPAEQTVTDAEVDPQGYRSPAMNLKPLAGFERIGHLLSGSNVSPSQQEPSMLDRFDDGWGKTFGTPGPDSAYAQAMANAADGSNSSDRPPMEGEPPPVDDVTKAAVEEEIRRRIRNRTPRYRNYQLPFTYNTAPSAPIRQFWNYNTFDTGGRVGTSLDAALRIAKHKLL